LIEGLQGKESGVKSEEERNAKVREGNVWIEDVQLFKAGLVPSKAAVPMEPIKQAAKL
jgi:insulysin